MATEDINAAGGIKGKKVRVIFEDDKSNAQEASNKVLQLIDRDKAIAILGEVASSRSKAGGLVANNKHIPMVTPSSTNVDVTQGREYVFRACFTDDQQGRSAASFAVEKLGKKKLAILYVAQDSYSSGLAASFREAAQKLGAQIVADKGYQQGETNFTTYLNEIKAANPELIFAPNYYSDMVPIARQAKDVGLSGAMFLGGDGWDSEDLLKGPPPSSKGPTSPTITRPMSRGRTRKRSSKTTAPSIHRDPSSLAAQGYDAARLLYDAMSRATGLAPDPIKDALAVTKGFQGATGIISIDTNRNAQKPVVVVQIKGGKFTYSSTVAGGVARNRMGASRGLCSPGSRRGR